ncbi:hypothetical protein ACH5RR_025897 [Cinchona calisaya]|uniref:Uncharacterized protein n=1 Tax=Cinchona calisaya TaxID=153742 RepID=A0ABD2Z4B8_9GENT
MAKGSSLGKARICVDLTKPRIGRVFVSNGERRRWQSTKYEDILEYCFFCHKVGHSDSKCLIINPSSKNGDSVIPNPDLADGLNATTNYTNNTDEAIVAKKLISIQVKKLQWVPKLTKKHFDVSEHRSNKVSNPSTLGLSIVAKALISTFALQI